KAIAAGKDGWWNVRWSAPSTSAQSLRELTAWSIPAHYHHADAEHALPDRRRRNDGRCRGEGDPRARRGRLDHARGGRVAPALQAAAPHEGPLERRRRGEDLARDGRDRRRPPARSPHRVGGRRR